MVTLTDREARALDILATNGAMMPARFAEEMWPDSGAVGAAVAYLGRLTRKGLVELCINPRYHTLRTLTDAGRKALTEHPGRWPQTCHREEARQRG